MKLKDDIDNYFQTNKFKIEKKNKDPDSINLKSHSQRKK